MADWNVASRFLEELQRHAQGRRHLDCPPPSLVTWYSTVFATEVACQDAPSKVRRLLDTLTEAGAISLPKGQDGWLPFPPPKLPLWIRFPSPSKLRLDQRHKTYPWGSELVFIASLPTVPHLDALLAINTWLRDGGRDVIVRVPLRERSVEITGDEKALDDVIRCQVLQTEGGGGITLDLLKAYLVPPPLAYEQGPEGTAGKPVLVVENAHTWHSFAEWNRTSGHYAAVIYGNGKMFVASFSHLRSIIQATHSAPDVRYFGDLDVAGLLIPIEASEGAINEGLPIPCAEDWLYEELLRHTPQPIPEEQQGGRTAAPGLVAWLPAHLRDAAQSVLQQRLRIAQECVGTHFLRGLP